MKWLKKRVGQGCLCHVIIRAHSAQQKISSENAVLEDVQFLSAWGIMIKTWGRVLLGGMTKIEQVQFFDSQTYLQQSYTINLKLFGNHGGIYRFRRKFKKDSGEIKPLGVHRNMIIGNWQYVCLLFCWSWPKGWDNFQKRGQQKVGGLILK